MRYQEKPYSCGAACVVNILQYYGIKISEEKVRELAGTTEKDGTSEFGILSALTTFFEQGIRCEPIVGLNKRQAFQMLKLNSPMIVDVMNSQHWAIALGLTHDEKSVIVIDPSNVLYNKEENGLRIVPLKDFYKWWRSKGEYGTIRVWRE